MIVESAKDMLAVAMSEESLRATATGVLLGGAERLDACSTMEVLRLTQRPSV